MAGGRRLHANLCNLRALYCKVRSCLRVGCMLPSWLRTRSRSTPSFITTGQTEEDKHSLGAVRTSAVLKYRLVKIHMLAVQKFTGSKFRSSYFDRHGRKKHENLHHAKIPHYTVCLYRKYIMYMSMFERSICHKLQQTLFVCITFDTLFFGSFSATSGKYW